MSNRTDTFADLDRFRLPVDQTGVRWEAPAKEPASSPKPKRIQGEFKKGPIPLAWLSGASALSGKALRAVALAVWFEAGRRKAKEVRLTTAIVQRFHVNRKAKDTALKAREKAGLVKAHREPRRNPVVMILDAPDGSFPSSHSSTRDQTFFSTHGGAAASEGFPLQHFWDSSSLAGILPWLPLVVTKARAGPRAAGTTGRAANRCG
jgi:hypothetical protein